MSTMTTVKQMQDQYLTFTEKVQTPIVKYVGVAADRIAGYVPARPAFLASLPTVAELVDNQMKFRKRVVDEQVAFVRSLVKAAHPVMVKVDATKTAPTAAEKWAERMVDKVADTVADIAGVASPKPVVKTEPKAAQKPVAKTTRKRVTAA